VRRLVIILASVALSPLGMAGDLARYFPGQDDSASKNRYAASERGTARILEQFNEPSLCCHPEETTREFRFTWLRTFDHPIVIRISERQDGNWSVVVKVASGQAGFDFDGLKLIHDKSTAVSLEAIIDLLNAFGPTKPFWTTLAYGGEVGSDGSEWLIEARSENGYHYVSRWSPEDGPVREIGELFLTVSGLKNEKAY
jgi:hypothetical protein